MNIGSYDLDSLRKLVRKLEKENQQLKSILKREKIPFYLKEDFFDTENESDEYDIDQDGRNDLPDNMKLEKTGIAKHG